jgi:hypothetical protein
MTTQEPTVTPGTKKDAASTTARREFLAKCGKLAVITPPAVTLLLSAASHNYAVAHSGSESHRGKHHRHHKKDFKKER